MKRLLTSLTMLLCSLLTFAQFSGTVSDSQGVKYTANDDGSTCYVSGHEDSYNATITIPEVYEGRTVTSIGGCAFLLCSDLNSVTISNSVTSIESGAFNYCSNLNSIIVENDNPKFDSRNNCNAIIETATNTLLYGCNNTVIPNSVTSIREWAFNGCNGLASMTIPNSVTSIGERAFYYCSGLNYVTIPNSVTSIGNSAFSDCSGLTYVTVYAETPISIDSDCFTNRKNARLYVPTGSKVAYQEADYWKEFKQIVEPSEAYDVWGLGTISDSQGVKYTANNDGSTCYVSGHMTNYSATITIPEVYEGRTVTSIHGAFFGCSGLTSVTIPNSVTSIGGSTFRDCSSLTSVTIPNSVTSIESGAFKDCSSLNSVDIPNSVTSIGDWAFDGCSSLTSVSISNSVTSIGIWAFHGCSGLTSVIVENGNPKYDSRNNCNAIIEIATNTLLYGCNNTVIPNSVTSIGDWAFHGFSGLTSVSIPNSVTSIGNNAFGGCSGLTSVSIPNTVTSIGYDAFSGCSSLTSVTIPNSVTSIIDRTFSGCSGLTSVTIPNSVTSIDGGAFWNCSGLTSVDIPNSVTSIGGGAFRDCSSLNSVTIPNSVKSIEWSSYYGGCFQGCSGLTSVTVCAKTPLSIGSDCFTNRANATLFVPEGSKEAYQAAPCWNEFKEIREIVEVTDISQMDNVIYIEDMEETRTAKQATISLKMKNTAAIRGFQFDLYLPEGVTVAKSNKNRIQGFLSPGRLPDEDEHELTFSEQGDGAIRFLCSSQYDETFTGNDGEIATLLVNIAEDMAEGDYPIKLKNMKLTETNISNYYETALVQSKLTVYAYVTGDISGDGKVDVSDYTGVANHIHGSTPAGFNAKAADVDKNNVIDVSDYTGIANIIHTGSIYGNVSSHAPRMLSPRRANTDLSAYDNVMYISPFTASANSQATLSIKMKNSAEIRGFQFDLYLPEGMTVVKSNQGRIQGRLSADRLPDEDEHELTFSEQADGAIRFLCSSQYDETFIGNDGEVATLIVDVAADMADGDYPILMKDMKLTETDISKFYTADDIETTVTIGEAAIVYTVLDETSTEVPEATTEPVDIKVMRTINAGEWSTICLPFSMTGEEVTAAFGEDVELKDFKDYEAKEDAGENIVGIIINFENINLANGMEANYPYLIKTSKNISEFTAKAIIEPDEEGAVVEYDNGKTGSRREVWGTFQGTFHAQTVVPENCLFLSGNKFWYSVGLTKMKAFRAYFDFVDVLASLEGADARVQFSFSDGETTGVADINRETITNNNSFYNLAGQRVEKPTKGLYITNGRKVVVK